MTDTVVHAGNADDGQTTPLSFYARKLPIIVVPGIMGTRLSTADASHRIVWDPVGLFSSSADPRRLADLAELEPDLWNPGSYKYAAEAQVVNFSHLVQAFYGDLCKALQEDLASVFEAKRMNVTPRVYASGYDWRQDNARSAQRLAAVVQRAREDCDDEKVIIVAHSMGGLVSRYFCKELGGERHVRALFLVASPTHGAPKGYVYLKGGMPLGGAIDSFIRVALLHKVMQESSRPLLRKMPSIYQLAPSSRYGHTLPSWMAFNPSRTGYPRFAPKGPLAPNPDDQFTNCDIPESQLYDDMYTGFGEDERERCANNPLVTLASGFHDRLRCAFETTHMHPHTYAIFATGVDTCVGAGIEYSGVVVDDDHSVSVVSDPVTWRSEGRGDGTVPVESAFPDNPSHAFRGALPVQGVEHGGMANDLKVRVREFLLETIPTII